MPDDDFFGDEPAPNSGPALRELPYKIVSAAEIWKPLEPQDFVIDPVFVRGNVGMICAVGSSLKTWMGLDAVLAIATGGEWLGRFACKRGLARIVDWESGNYELRRRLQKMASGRGLSGAVEGVSFVTMPNLWMNSVNFREHLAVLAEGHALVLFDSFAAGSGGEDENDARIAGGLNHMKAVADETGCTFIALHHARKSAPGGDAGDEREMVRGNSSIFSACDAILTLRKEGDEGTMVAKQVKSRGGPAVEPFALRIDDVSGGGVTLLATDMGDPCEAPAGSSLDKIKSQIIKLLAHTKDIRTRSALARRLTGRKTTKFDALDELIELGVVVEVEGKALRLKSEVS